MTAQNATSSPNSAPHLRARLADAFGFSDFRPLQERAVRAALAGQDVLLVMPTGAGKSLCFQLPAILQAGLTLVVSPLIALMQDQVDALQQRPEFAKAGVACIHSGRDWASQKDALRMLRDGQLSLVYVAPERLRAPAFVEALQQVKVARVVVDEAHCISQWGHDFRPDYLSLRASIQALGSPPVLAATATAAPRVQRSIIENLGMRDPACIIGGFNRPNLHYAVHRVAGEGERANRLGLALPRMVRAGGTGILYTITRKQCEAVAGVCQTALGRGGGMVGCYHAGMDSDARSEVQDRWLAGKVQVLVATCAFGMGIDKPDVRFVVHCGYPESLEAYYQEAGRAGRDGRKSRCIILSAPQDYRLRRWMIDNDSVVAEDVQTAHTQIRRQAAKGVARIARSWWWSQLGWSEIKTRLVLGIVERRGLDRRVEETGADAVWAPVLPQVGEKLMRSIDADLRAQTEARRERLADMVQYCKTRRCRRRTILSYFGDNVPPAADSFCCDNCEARARRDLERGEVE